MFAYCENTPVMFSDPSGAMYADPTIVAATFEKVVNLIFSTAILTISMISQKNVVKNFSTMAMCTVIYILKVCLLVFG